MKHLIPFYYFLVTLPMLWHFCAGSAFPKRAENDRKCGGGQISSNPTEIGMSPGFISASTAYIGHHLCTNDGTCEKPPLICPQSSCCLSTYNITNIGTILLPVSYSQCGCYDPKRKTCKPQSAFRLDYDNCLDYGQVTSKFELAQISIPDSSCNESASVDLELDNKNGDVRIRIKSQFCLSKAGSTHRTIDQLFGEVEQEYYRLGCTRAKPLKSATGLPFSKYSERCSLRDDDQLKIQNCGNNSVSNTVTISPDFQLFRATHNLLNSGPCGYHGDCKSSTSDCLGTSCCLASFTGNSSGGYCDCLPGNSKSCLLDHKTLKVGHTTCTDKGELVQRKMTVRIPSAESQNCQNGTTSSWTTTSVNFVNLQNGKLQVIIETRQCVLSGKFGNNYLEIEDTVKAEIDTEGIEINLENM